MNCNRAENWMLLEQSGELSPRQSRRLDEHRAACPRCQAFQNDLSRVLAAAGSVRLDAAPAPAVMRRIMAAAEAPGSQRERWFGYPAWQTLAATAALVLLFGLSFWATVRRHAPEHQTADQDTRVAELFGLLTMMIEAESPEAGIQSQTQTDLQSVARQLLILEGMAVELPGVEEAEAIPDEAHPPTTLRWRSSPAFPSEECG